MAEQKYFFDYFQREMAYLRHEGARFAEHYPKVARRLDFSNVESADPHVERLLQSFAFLTARLQKDADDLFPRIANALLETLYPQFIAPLPSSTIAKMDVADAKGKLTSRFKIAKGTELFAHALEGGICRFQTTSDIDLYPLMVKEIDLVSTLDLPKGLGSFTQHRVLRLNLMSLAGSITDIDLQNLRFHIAGDPIIQNKIYEALFLSEPRCAVSFGPMLQPTRMIPAQENLLSSVGFAPEEAMLPYPDHAHPGYRLLQEYFAYPQKFMFVDVNARSFKSEQKELTLYIELADEVGLEAKDISSQLLQLGCVPLINLFHKISEPLRIDHKRLEYRLTADQRREETTEIHSIKQILGIYEGQRDPYLFTPYFSYKHAEVTHEQNKFWHARRKFSRNFKGLGDDIFLSFVDYDFDPAVPGTQSVYAELLCTNRWMAANMPARTELQSDASLPSAKIYCLDRPTQQKYPNRETASQWRLISHLALGHLSLTDSKVSINILKELIQQYGNFGDEQVIPELNIIQDFQAERITQRLGYEAWRGFVQGTRFELTFIEGASRDTSEFLFANILNHVLPQFASINSFTQLAIKKKNLKGIWKEWAPRSGNKALI
jgi:type VI secretion system protein ImpG